MLGISLAKFVGHSKFWVVDIVSMSWATHVTYLKQRAASSVLFGLIMAMLQVAGWRHAQESGCCGG